MVPVRVDLGTAPITVSSFWPPLKIITVGMERDAVLGGDAGGLVGASFTCFDAGASGITRSSARSDAKRASDRANRGRMEGFPASPRPRTTRAGTGTRAGVPEECDEPRERAR